MCHPLYPVARGLVGRHVHIHHRNGSVYRGTLHSAVDHGIYVMPGQTGVYPASSDTDIVDVHVLDGAENGLSGELDLVYYPGRYFAYGALTGLTLGAAAAFLW
jgi:hypothetical protein